MVDLRRSELPLSKEEPPRVEDAGDLVDDAAEDTDTDIGLALEGCLEDISLMYSMSLVVELLKRCSARCWRKSERTRGDDGPSPIITFLSILLLMSCLGFWLFVECLAQCLFGG